jgi:hypothetical protein
MKYGAVELVKVAFTKEAYKKVSHNLQIYNFRRGLTFFIKLKKMERILIFLILCFFINFFSKWVLPKGTRLPVEYKRVK